MKSTGIVRRIDELGRVVIPKEIRKTLRIKEGDPLEIFTEKDELYFKKYSPINSLSDFAEGFALSLTEITEKTVLICDTDVFICASGYKGKDFVNEKISENLLNQIKQRKSLLINKKDGGELVPLTKTESDSFYNQIIVPIISSGDLLGAVVVLDKDSESVLTSETVKLARLVASSLSRQFE